MSHKCPLTISGQISTIFEPNFAQINFKTFTQLRALIASGRSEINKNYIELWNKPPTDDSDCSTLIML